MNDAHLHLMLVHLPVVLVPLGTAIFSVGLWRVNATVRRVALNIFVLAAAFGVAAFLYGEGAEELVEDLAGIAESAIEQHEDSAVIALWLTVALGVLSLLSLIAEKFRANVVRVLAIPLLILSILSAAALAYTAQQGGMIRHPEAFKDAAQFSAEDHDD